MRQFQGLKKALKAGRSVFFLPDTIPRQYKVGAKVYTLPGEAKRRTVVLAILARAGHDIVSICPPQDWQRLDFTEEFIRALRRTPTGTPGKLKPNSSYALRLEKCPVCAKYFLGTYMAYAQTDRGEQGVCRMCAEDITRNQGRIHEYSHRAETTLKHNTDATRYNAFTVGVEIETSQPVYSKALKMCKELEDNQLAIGKRDSSIQAPGDGAGVEVVTPPMDFDRAESHIQKLAAILERYNVSAWDNSSCGLHIHIGKNSLTRPQIARAKVFCAAPENQHLLDFVAGRAGKDGPAQSYCRRGLTPGSTMAKLAKTLGDGCDSRKYSAINWTKPDTIEFRIFRSTRKAWRIMANIEFCHAILQYCSSHRPVNGDTFIKALGISRLRATWEAGKEYHRQEFGPWLRGEGRHGKRATRYPHLVFMLANYDKANNNLPETV